MLSAYLFPCTNAAVNDFPLRSIAECTIVHYRGTGPALPDLLTGKIQIYTDAVVTGLPPVHEGRARVLAIASRLHHRLQRRVPG